MPFRQCRDIDQVKRGGFYAFAGEPLRQMAEAAVVVDGWGEFVATRTDEGIDRLARAVPPCVARRLPARYIPDFIVVTDTDQNVIVEIKGQMTDNADAKAKAAERWTAAVTRLGTYGTWHYLLVTDPGKLGIMLNAYTKKGWVQGEFQLT